MFSGKKNGTWGFFLERQGVDPWFEMSGEEHAEFVAAANAANKAIKWKASGEPYMVALPELPEYPAMKAQEAQGELNRRLAELSTEEARARAEIDGEYAAARKTKLAALLAVKEQRGWPLNVQWPA
jgi:hypothetical protein